jgi:3-dehydrotetronate 4-kinase
LQHGRVGLVAHEVVARGAEAVARRLESLRAEGCTMAIVDAVADADLLTLAEAAQALPLVVAGSGLAIGLPRWHGCKPDARAQALPPARGAAAIVAGSCSAATQGQVACFIADGGSAFAIDPLRAAAGHDLAAEALAWAAPRLGDTPVLVYATAAPAEVQAVQSALGAAQASALVEDVLSRIAQGLVERGVGRLIVAGGETSGACVQALGLHTLRIGAQIDPGVPWCHASERGLHLALKSGNFGAPDFFSRAFRLLA